MAYCFLCFGLSLYSVQAQHHIQLDAQLDAKENTLKIKEKLTYYNQSADTIRYVILNDWNHSFSSNKTPLAQRFSDEFIRNFYLSGKNQKGFTQIDSINSGLDGKKLKWEREKNHPDLIKIYLKKPLEPNEKTTLEVVFTLKIPQGKFTGYGYTNNTFNLKEWFLFPVRYTSKKGFEGFSNLNLDDASAHPTHFEAKITFPADYEIHTDFEIVSTQQTDQQKTFQLKGKNRIEFRLNLEKEGSFGHYKNEITEVVTNLADHRLHEAEKAILIDKITHFVAENIGNYPHTSILVTQSDYDRNPVYGLNQLPSFISPFSDEFQYEIKFLKTYLNNFLKNSLNINIREDGWIIDAYQIYFMQKYIQEYYPNVKLLGDLSGTRFLKRYHFSELDFNEQYYNLYLFMARNNIDQAAGNSKDKQIRFNEKISSKYKTGVAFKYFSDLYGQKATESLFKEFYQIAQSKPTNRKDFKSLSQQKANTNTQWFFKNLIETNNVIDYQLKTVKQISPDSLSITIKNKGQSSVPIALYGFNKKKILFKQWLPKINIDTTFVIPQNGADRIVLNHDISLPEYNLRNNRKNIHNGLSGVRPYKFSFFTDIEDPSKRQIFYVPIMDYNLYNGLYLGMRLHNKSIINKPFEVDINPFYSYRSNGVVGNAALSYNHFIRNNNLYLIRYYLSGSQFDYTSDARYYKFTPAISLIFRDKDDLRNNYSQRIMAKYVLIHREKSIYTPTENLIDYGIFNLKYNKNKSELLSHKGFNTDVQFAKNFGKAAIETSYRYLFTTNQQFHIRLFAGTFLYRNINHSFFDFALDRPTDYLFEYNYYGRSESTGIYSQQIIIAEGGFKSKLRTPFANQWLTTANFGFNVWNWFELYGDVGVVKNQYQSAEFLYDSGVRISLVPDFFELYFPVNSSNGWEIAQPNYGEKIRFVVTLSPQTLVRLYTRRWF